MRRTALVLITAAVCWTVPVTVAHAQAQAQAQAAEPPTIAAEGDGHAFLRPDRARLFVGVHRVRSTSRAARAATSREVARLVRTLRSHGIARSDVQTAGIEIARERVRKGGHDRRLVRYRAMTELDVRSSDVPHLGALIDALSQAGADDVGGPDFGFSDPSQGLILATRRALADARRRADDAAAQLGLRVTGIASVDLAPDGGAVLEASSGSAAAGGGSNRTRVLPGRQEFSASVRVVYTAVSATT